MKKEALETRLFELFENDDELLTMCMEELDAWSGFLGDDRYYEMECLDEFYCDSKPLDFLYRVFYGYDYDTSDRAGGRYSEFNPNRAYFYYNGYGNLVSTDYKDYSDHLDDYFINELVERAGRLDLPEEVLDIMEEYETEEE